MNLLFCCNFRKEKEANELRETLFIIFQRAPQVGAPLHTNLATIGISRKKFSYMAPQEVV